MIIFVSFILTLFRLIFLEFILLMWPAKTLKYNRNNNTEMESCGIGTQN